MPRVRPRRMTFRRSITSSAATLVSTVVFGLFTSLCITRILEKEGRGIYSLLQADVTLLTFLLSFSLPVTLVYVLAKEEHARERIIGTTLMAFLVASAVVIGAACLAWREVIGLDLILPSVGDRDLYIGYLAWTIIYSLFQGLITSTFLGLRMLREVNRMNLLAALTNLAFFALLLLFTNEPGVWNIRPVLHLIIGSQALLMATWLFRYVRLVGVPPRIVWDRALLRTMMTFSVLGYASSLAHQLHRRLDIWFLSEYSNMAELGLYAVAMGVGQLFLMMPTPIIQVLNPHLIREELPSVMPTFILYARLIFTMTLIGGLAAAALSSWVLPTLYGPSFAGSVVPFQLLLPGILFANQTRMLALLVIRSGRMGLNLLASASGLTCTVGINLWLIPKYGINGAAIASSLANFAIFLVVLWAVTVRLRIPRANYYILRPSDLGRLWKS